MSEKKKKKSRLKKILKTIGKIALAGGAAYGASKLFGGGKKKFGHAAGFLKSGAAGGPYGPTPFHPAQGNRSKWETMARDYTDPIMTGGAGVKSGRNVWKGDQSMAANRNIFQDLKKGGRVTGIAKRGFGRALMKGKK